MNLSAQGYQRLVSSIGKTLGLGSRASDTDISNHCADQLDRILGKANVAPSTMDDVLVTCAAGLDLHLTEIHSTEDIQNLLRDYPPTAEPVMAQVADEMRGETEAIVIQRPNRKQWQPPYLAVINCQGEHFHRRYFSKWHEVVHLLLEGRQMTFAFRKTTEAERRQPLEQLVDKVAARLAFHRPIFSPVLRSEIETHKRLTFDGVERIRRTIAPNASWQATMYACVREAEQPVAYMRLGLGLKKAEIALANTPELFPDEVPAIKAKLRVKDFSPNAYAEKSGLRMYKSMSVSDDSLPSRAFANGTKMVGEDDFGAWRDGAPNLPVFVETRRHGNELECLVHAV